MAWVMLLHWATPRSRLCSKRSLRWFSAAGALLSRSQTPVEHVKIRLRDYQEECIQSVLSSLRHGHKRLGISLATGSGKTVIFTQLIERVEPLSGMATQTLVLAHRRELVEQAARHCSNAYRDKTVEVEMGALHASGTADITVASMQSITSGDRIDKFDPRRFKLVLVDEAHHIVAPAYLRILAHFGLDVKRQDSPHLVGVSATFSRFDGLRLGAAIDEIVYHKDYVDMIGDKWLSDVVFTTVESAADVSRVRAGVNGDFQPAQLSLAVNTDKVNDITVRSWLAKCQGRKSTLVFCVDLAHVAGLTQKFRSYGIDARSVTGETHKVERSERLDAFKKGDFPVLVNCGVFTEGTDIPCVDCVILARPTKSRNLLVQMIGRGMRLHPGKKNCHVIDMVSSLETGIVTTPTLFGLDPGQLVEAASVDELKEMSNRKEAEKDRNDAVGSEPAPGRRSEPSLSGGVTFTEYDSVFDLIADTSGEQSIRRLSEFAWVQVGQDRFVLSGPTGTYLRIERAADGDDGSARFRAVEVRALPPGVSASPFASPRELLQAATFADAVHGCDKYAGEHFPFMFISKRRRWREGPPTEGQLKFLNKLRGSQQKPLTVDDITKGKAGDMITKFKHGARGQFAEIEADRRRIKKREMALEQERTRKLREVVSVGPVAS